MEKKHNKSNARNIRLGEPCGLIGTPPDAPVMRCGSNVIIITNVTDGQVDEVVDFLFKQRREKLSQ